VTKRLEEFDFEATCRTLEGVAESSSEEIRAAIELAAYALHFLYARDQFTAFREYLRDVTEPATPEVHVDQVFDDMPQAMSWLSASSAASGLYVKVGEKTYAVWRDAEGKRRLVPHISPRDLEE
jgi:hypothetical protein